MRVLVTGSSGHLGDCVVQTFMRRGHVVVGLDLVAGPSTTVVGSLLDSVLVREAMEGVDVVVHAAALHKFHLAACTAQDFVRTNIAGTLGLLEAAKDAGALGFVFTSSTSAFGAALRSTTGDRATWITEKVQSAPKDIYGTSKRAAEDLCELFFRTRRLPSVVLRVARFFAVTGREAPDEQQVSPANANANDFLYRRVDLTDAADAHLAAAQRVGEIGFGRYVISATTPFASDDLRRVHHDAPSVVRALYPEYEEIYQRRGWKMRQSIDRVYVNELARTSLGWQPRVGFRSILAQLKNSKG